MHRRLIKLLLVTIFTFLSIASCESEINTLGFYASPNVLNFNSVGIGDSKIQEVTIYNKFSFDVTITNISITGVNSSDFTITEGDATPINLDAGTGIHLIKIQFDSTNPLGNKSAKLQIERSGSSAILDVNLSADTINSPLVSSNPATFDFGQVIINDTTGQNFIISNTGTIDLTITEMQLAGANASEFNLTGTTNGTVTPGSDIIATVEFTPAYIGIKSATLVVISDATNSDEFEITLAGEGVNLAPVFSINPTSYDFGSVSVSATDSQTFVITNTGNDDLFILSIQLVELSGSAFSITAGFAPFKIAPAGNKDLIVEFAPTAIYTYVAYVEIVHNAGSNVIVLIQGIGSSGVQTQIFLEDWDGSGTFPFNWNIIDGGSGGTPPYDTWFLADSNLNLTPGSGNCAMCDSDGAGTGVTLDEYIESPVIDCSAFSSGTIILEFDFNFQRYDQNAFDDYAILEVNDGSQWIEIETYNTDTPDFWGGEHKSYDVSTYTLNNADFQVRFYYTGSFDWFIEVDNIELTHTP